MHLYEAIAHAALETYARLPPNGKPKRRSNHSPEWTVLAAVCLFRSTVAGWDTRCVSLGTGLKALPHARLPVHGDVLHDSHAEVIARRGFKAWLYGQIERVLEGEESGARDEADVLVERVDGDEWRLKAGWRVGFYVSTLPCGDASTYFLSLSAPAETEAPGNLSTRSIPTASLAEGPSPRAQPPSLAVAASLGMRTSRDPSPLSLLPAPTPPSPAGALPPPSVHRGRASYSSLSILRTKPGRADSPPTTSHSCSDKLALWALCGLQGALLSRLGVRRVPVEVLVMGGFAEWEDEPRERIRAECARAVGGRLEAWAREAGLAEDGFRVPKVGFTREAFDGAREVVAKREGVDVADVVGCAESLSYVADLPAGSAPVEVITNGIRQGASAKRKPGEPLGPKNRSRLCKLSLYQAHLAVCDRLDALSKAALGTSPTRATETASRLGGAALAPAPADSPDTSSATSHPARSRSTTYHVSKHPSPLPSSPPSRPLSPSALAPLNPSERYRLLKTLVRAGPFAGWLVSGREWESFDGEGRVVSSGEEEGAQGTGTGR